MLEQMFESPNEDMAVWKLGTPFHPLANHEFPAQDSNIAQYTTFSDTTF